MLWMNSQFRIFLTCCAAACSVVGSKSTNVCEYMVCKYVDQKCSAAILVAKMSAGVATELKLRDPLLTGNEACK